MNTSLRCFVIALVPLALCPHLTAAQDAVPDTTAVRLVVGPTVEHLHGHLIRALLEPEAQPWSVTVPDSTSSAWLSYADRVRTMLRARAVAPADSATRHLSVRPPEVRGDSLSIVLFVEERYPCRNQRGIFFTSRAFWWVWRDARSVSAGSELPIHVAGRCQAAAAPAGAVTNER